MANNYFKFKQFTIIQEKAAMKVGTDGVLLGSWADVQNTKNILDIGAGTGLIALMLAQRSDAQITAVEIEENAASEAMLNVSKSPWKDRVKVNLISIQKFANQVEDKFDLIVSNPPFFSNSFKSVDTSRTMARHTDSLTYSELILCSSRLLQPDGRLAVILPCEASVIFQQQAMAAGFNLQQKANVQPKPGKVCNRVLLSFGKKKAPLVEENLSIYNEDGTWSESYKELTRDFYLYI